MQPCCSQRPVACLASVVTLSKTCITRMEPGAARPVQACAQRAGMESTQASKTVGCPQVRCLNSGVCLAPVREIPSMRLLPSTATMRCLPFRHTVPTWGHHPTQSRPCLALWAAMQRGATACRCWLRGAGQAASQPRQKAILKEAVIGLREAAAGTLSSLRRSGLPAALGVTNPRLVPTERVQAAGTPAAAVVAKSTTSAAMQPVTPAAEEVGGHAQLLPGRGALVFDPILGLHFDMESGELFAE